MRTTLVAGALSLMAVSLLGVARAAEAPESLDLSAFAPFDEGAAVRYEPDGFVPECDRAAVRQFPPSSGMVHKIPDGPDRRFYLSSIIGGSFPVLTADDTPSPILTAGGALGIAMERSNGRLRVELEGRYRDAIEQTYIGINTQGSSHAGGPAPAPSEPNLVGTQQATASGGWSAMANVWRDFTLTDQIDLYGGGGIGGAGFATSFQQLDTQPPSPVIHKYLTEYAWQLGFGGIWNLNDRVAVDVSYRWFCMGWSVTANDLAYGFLRNEILLTLRIYEPFRGLMR